jgi:hypothetical protein
LNRPYACSLRFVGKSVIFMNEHDWFIIFNVYQGSPLKVFCRDIRKVAQAIY